MPRLNDFDAAFMLLGFFLALGLVATISATIHAELSLAVVAATLTGAWLSLAAVVLKPERGNGNRTASGEIACR